MKKYIIVIICAISLLCSGCRDKENIQYISDKLTETNEEYTDEEVERLETGITQWAEGFLLVSSELTEEEKRTINQSFYKCIVSDEDREKVQEDRQEFYQDSYVKIGLVDTEIESAKKVEYEDQELGKVACTVSIYGTRNHNRFQRKYDLDLIVDFQEEVSIREIDEISWKSAEF